MTTTMKLTKTSVEALEPRSAPYRIFDVEIKGFGVKVFPTGAKSFFYIYRNQFGAQKTPTIGKLSATLTTDQARKRAKELAHAVFRGEDPLEETREQKKAATLNELFDQYLASAGFGEKAESTQKIDRGRIERHLRPTLGKYIAKELTAEQIKRARDAIAKGRTAARVKTCARGLAKVTGGPGTADKAVTALRAIYAWAIEQGFATENPAAKVKVKGSGEREDVVEDADAYAKMFTALDRMENEKRIRPAAADAIRFIALTGARRGEAIGLRWAWVDLKAGRVVIPAKEHKTGHRTGKPRIITLPAEAQAIIARQPAGEPDDFVFRPAKGEGAMALQRVWHKVREEAGLPKGLVVHGLRHSIGTHLAMAGASPVELMEVLGHRQIKTTLRYIHFAERARSTLAERAASVAVAGMKSKTEKAEVIELDEEKRKA